MTTPDPEQDIGNLHFEVLPHMGLSSHPQPLSLWVRITERQTDRPVWVRCAPLALTWFKPGSQGPVPMKLARLWRGLPDHPSRCLLAGRAAGSQSRVHQRCSRRGSYVTGPLSGVCVPSLPSSLGWRGVGGAWTHPSETEPSAPPAGSPTASRLSQLSLCSAPSWPPRESPSAQLHSSLLQV